MPRSAGHDSDVGNAQDADWKLTVTPFSAPQKVTASQARKTCVT